MSKTLERIDAAEAARRLGVSPRSLDRIQARGVFTVQRDSSGRMAKRFFFADEIEAYLNGNAGSDGSDGERAVMALRIEKRRRRR